MPRIDRKWWTLASVSVGIFMLLLDITIVNIALPDLVKSLHASFSDLQWVIDAYALSLAALLLIAGSLGDLVGARRVFVAGLTVFCASSVLCGFAGGPLFLIAFRAVQGVGGAAMFATSLALLAHEFRGRDRGVAAVLLLRSRYISSAPEAAEPQPAPAAEPAGRRAAWGLWSAASRAFHHRGWSCSRRPSAHHVAGYGKC